MLRNQGTSWVPNSSGSFQWKRGGGGPVDEVFERFLRGSAIFRNRDVLRHDYVPERLPHREAEIRTLASILAPALRGQKCSNAFIYGKTGTGKTAVARYVLGRLVVKAREIGAPVAACYVNCRMAGTEYRILASLCSSLGVKVPFTGLAKAEVLERFRRALFGREVVFITMLDEVDVLVEAHGDALLYELTRLNTELDGSKICLIGISNDLTFKEHLDPRVLSSLSEEEVVFRPYNASQLRDILWERAREAFVEGAVSEAVIGLCAALSAQEHGDARRALDLLRVAGEIAERRGARRVEVEHVREALKRIEYDRTVEAIRSLPLHAKLVLLAVYERTKKASSAITGEIYAAYSALCGRMGLSPLTQRRISSLINELDMMGLLNAQLVNMGRYGRTKKIRLAIQRSLLREVLAQEGLT
ncbi:cell division control protein Cdc6 [Candidatus Bathyarchaeota archaeon]|nr:MAG: cell division control protein Cdc6 [Candidatus Bathyarchaeota archaeon]